MTETKTVVYCDICGGVIDLDNEYRSNGGGQYKIKKRDPFSISNKWEYIDVHRRCLIMLIREAKKKDEGVCS